MSTTATKEKLIRLANVTPPDEIRDNTKARRAWLAAEMDRINAEPNRLARIIDTGSYQRLAVYEVTRVEGRLRHRGACQCCGNWHVVDTDKIPLALVGTGGIPERDTDASKTLHTGALVMHGYNRPGDGFLVGRCPGVGIAPLNVQKDFTKQWSTSADSVAAAWVETLEKTEVEVREALAANRSPEGQTCEPGAYQAQPTRPQIHRHRRDRPESWTDAEREAVHQYEVDKIRWAKQFPKTARYEFALAERAEAKRFLGGAQATVEHFRMLLSSGIYGMPLKEEVVT